MLRKFTYLQFCSFFNNDEDCLNEITKKIYPDGIPCPTCLEITHHYKIAKRPAYVCKHCRHQVFPLVGTVFEKSSTPLRLWLYAMYLMTQTRAHISIRALQNELGVTYKTAWRIYHQLHSLMKQNNGDLLVKSPLFLPKDSDNKGAKVRRWILFNTIEIKVVHRQKTQE